MSSLAMKRVVATALAGATIAWAIGVGEAAASADPESVPSPPSSIAAPAGQAYEDARLPAEPLDESQPVADEPSGFDLVSAAIGAAAGAGLIIIALAAGGLARRRPLTRRDGTIGA